MGVYIDAQLGLAASRRLEKELAGQEQSYGNKLETHFRQAQDERDLDDLLEAGSLLGEKEIESRWSLAELAHGCGVIYCDQGDGTFYLDKDLYQDDPYNSLRAFIFTDMGVKIDPSDDEIPYSFVDSVVGLAELLEQGYLHEACSVVQSYLVGLRSGGVYGEGPEAVYDADICPSPLAPTADRGGDLAVVSDFERSITPEAPLLEVYRDALDMVCKLKRRKVASAYFNGSLPVGKSRRVCPISPGAYYRSLRDVHLLDRRGVLATVVSLAVGDPDPRGRFSRHARLVEAGDLYPIEDSDFSDDRSESGYSSDGSEFSLVARNRPRDRYMNNGTVAVLRLISNTAAGRSHPFTDPDAGAGFRAPPEDNDGAYDLW